ncbi:unknown protein [Bathycoccus prasinos]|uniref:Uncharacterized protein n=1 Tax=Bathycoccus prasinos TaxID=41875 RepID=K8EU94_9CHLO|nr:unknown protein [Bathycoccus prasinos]CCO16025.1 unknown protein [Bathycoccus prasinos]|eukprot:XP_007513500.1 unknown protein [Bathycoccus prasinos]
MDVDQSLDALIKAAPKATKKPTTASNKAKKKVTTLKKKVQPKKKVSSVKVSVKSGTKMIRKNTGGRGKPIGGRAVGMAIDQVVRNTGGARSRINNIVSPNAKTNEAPTKLIVSNLDFNVTEKDIKSVWKNLLFFAFSSLSVCVYTRARLNVIAHATKVNRGIKKKRGSCGKVNSLSVFLGCVLVVRALGDCSLFLRKNPAKAPPTKKIEICRNTFFRRVTQTHTQTYTQTMTCKQSFSDRVIAVK